MSDDLDGPAHVRSLQLALAGRYDDALAMLAERSDAEARGICALIAHIRRRDIERMEAMKKCRHDVGNALAIAQASIEGMLDGVIGITEPRLRRMLAILADVNVLISAAASAQASEPPATFKRTQQPYDVAAAELFALSPLGVTKNVGISYISTIPASALASQDGAEREMLRGILLHAMRGTPPGGLIRFERTDPREFTLTAGSAAAPHVVRASNGAGRLVADDGAQATIVLAF